MKLYETTIIYDPGLEEARINEEVDRVTQPIAQAGGEVVEVQRWGKKKLAYNIRKRRDGTYIHVKHKSPAPLIGEMDRRFRLNESVLREGIAARRRGGREGRSGEGRGRARRAGTRRDRLDRGGMIRPRSAGRRDRGENLS